MHLLLACAVVLEHLPPPPQNHQAEHAGNEKDGKGGDTESVLVPGRITKAAERGDEAAVLALVDGGGQANAFDPRWSQK